MPDKAKPSARAGGKRRALKGIKMMAELPKEKPEVDSAFLFNTRSKTGTDFFLLKGVPSEALVYGL